MTHNNDSIRTPLGRARGLGSAREGAHHWWMQRASSVALIPLCLFFLMQFDRIVTTDHAAFIAWAAEPCVAVGLLLFIVTAFYHAALGIQVIVEDYVHGEGAKIAVLLLNKIFFFFLGVAAVFAVIRISFGQ